MQLLDPAYDPSATRLIVYDLDGTLIDAFEDIWRGVNHAMRAVRLPELDFALVKSYVGDGAEVLIRRCLGERHAARFDEVFPPFRAYYIDNPNPTVRVYPGVEPTLATLRERGYQQAILSNKPHEVTLHTCAQLGLDRRIDAIWGESPERPRKPAAGALELVMQHFKASPASTLMVGDGRADHAVAAAAGVPMCAVTWGLLDREQATALRPAVLIEQLADLLSLSAPLPVASHLTH